LLDRHAGISERGVPVHNLETDCGVASAASLPAIAADLAARGYLNVNGKEFSAASVASMLGA
jgi:hypothetical protein